MKDITVETITKPNDSGTYTSFKSEQAARKFAIKESMKAGVIETFLSCSDDDDSNYEVMEYYKKGKLGIKVA